MSGIGYYGSQYGGGYPSTGSFPEPSKPKIHTLVDSFDGPDIDPAKWDDWGTANTNIIAGQLHLSTNATAGYFGMTSADDYDFQDSYVLAQLVDAGPQTAVQVEAQPVAVLDGANNGFQWVIAGGTISAMKRLGGVFDVLQTATYDEDVHKWFRISESGGVITFYYSTNGTSWTSFATTDDTDVDTFSMYAIITTGAWGDAPAATYVVDNFNVVSTNYSIEGTLLLSGTVASGQNHSRSISGTLYTTGAMLGFVDPYIREDIVKTYEYKIYDPDTGAFLGRWDDVISDFSYSQEINSAGGAIDITLARNSDSVARGLETLADDSSDPIITDSSDEIIAETETSNTVGTGTNVALNLNVEVYVFKEDDADLTGTLIFTGYISKFVTQYGQQEQTIVTLFPHSAELDNWVLENDGADAGETRVKYDSDTPPNEPSAILKDTLDKFNAAGGVPSYDQGSTTIDDTGSTVSYTFNVNTELEVIKKVVELSPTDWFWYYDMALNNVHLHAKPSTKSHTFILGKHILELHLEQYIEELTNTVYVSGGEISPGVNLFKKYEDATSITDWRRGVARINDSRLKVESSAQIIAESMMDRASTPRYRSTIKISDKVYNIESITLGQVIGFGNFGNFVDALTMQVVRIDYTPDYVQLQLDTLLPSVPKRLEDVKRNLMQEEMKNNPDEPTA